RSTLETEPWNIADLAGEPACHRASLQLVERIPSGTNFRKCGTAMHISDNPPPAVAQLIDNGWRSKSRSGPASEASQRAHAFRRAARALFWLWPTDRSVTPVPKGCWDRPDR